MPCELLVEACGIQFPDQGWNPDPLHWEQGALATGPPGNSCSLLIMQTSLTVILAHPPTSVFFTFQIKLVALKSLSQGLLMGIP